MAYSRQPWLIIAPLALLVTSAWAEESFDSGNLFGLDPAELDPIQYSRTNDTDLSRSALSRADSAYERYQWATRQTEFSFKLKPKRPKFSREGAFGLNLFTDPQLDVRSRLIGPTRFDTELSEIHDGFEYSAGVRIEHEDEDIDGTAYVSSSQLGLSYGRLGRLWYGGINVNLEQFTEDPISGNQTDVLSLDFTTGRRLGITGLTKHSPLWLLSVQGNVDLYEWDNSEDLESSSDWYLNPSLFWQQPGFTFSAQMQVPVEFENVNDEGEPDYRLRAVIEKQFK